MTSLDSLSSLWRKHGTKLLLVFAAAMLVYAGFHYKRNQDAQRTFEVQNALNSAWRGVELVQAQQFSMIPATPQEVDSRTQTETNVNQNVQTVLDNADPKTDALRLANASLARGELYWALAHAPAPAPSTQPADAATSQPAKDYLSLAATAYEKIVSDYSTQIEPLTLARFGLGAVAEERHDIAAARQQYQALIDNAAVSTADKSMAQTRLGALNQLEKPLLLLPATQPAVATTPLTNKLTNFNFGPTTASSVSAPTTQPQ